MQGHRIADQVTQVYQIHDAARFKQYSFVPNKELMRAVPI